MTAQGRYQIRVQGWIGKRWASWFDDLDVILDVESDGRPVTTLTGEIPDQTALRGILSRIWDLNLTIIAVIPIEMNRELKGN